AAAWFVWARLGCGWYSDSVYKEMLEKSPFFNGLLAIQPFPEQRHRQLFKALCLIARRCGPRLIVVFTRGLRLNPHGLNSLQMSIILNGLFRAVSRSSLVFMFGMAVSAGGETSELWGQAGELWIAGGRLPDFSYAGYHCGESAFPSVAPGVSV